MTTPKLYIYNNKDHNKVIFRTKYWQDLAEKHPLYSQLFLNTEGIDLSNLPLIPPNLPSVPGTMPVDWNLWATKAQQEINNLKTLVATLETQIQQEKAKTKLATDQEKLHTSSKDKIIKDLSELLNQEQVSYLKLQNSIKITTGEITDKDQIIADNTQKIKDLQATEKRTRDALNQKENDYNDLRIQKDQELLVKDNEIATLKLIGGNLTIDQQNLIAQHQETIAQSNANHQQELEQEREVRASILDKINKLEKEIGKQIGQDCQPEELTVKLAQLKPWFINIQLTNTWNFVEEAYQELLAVKEIISGNSLDPSEENEWLKKENIAAAKANILVILNNSKPNFKGAVEEVFLKQIIRELRSDYVATSQQLTRFQAFVNNQKGWLENADLLAYLNGWEVLEGWPETNSPNTSLPSSGSSKTPVDPPKEQPKPISSIDPWPTKSADIQSCIDEVKTWIDYLPLSNRPKSPNWQDYLKNTSDIDSFQEKIKILRSIKVSIDWETILNEIYLFALTKQPSEATIQQFLHTKNYPNPLEGIDLQGWERIKLLKLRQGTATSQLTSGKGDFADYQNWTALYSPGDGNCFLNSLSIFLVGNVSLATRLRAALCLFLMNNLDYVETIYSKDSYGNIISQKTHAQSLFYKLTENEGHPLAKSSTWLATDDAKYFSLLLSRPLRILYRPTNKELTILYGATNPQLNQLIKQFKTNGGGWGKLEYIDYDLNYLYDETWTICHVSGNHFEPLVSPTPEKIEPNTPFYRVFISLEKFLPDLLNGSNDRVISLEDGSYEVDIKNDTSLDETTKKTKVKEKIRQIFSKVGITSDAEYNLANSGIKKLVTNLKKLMKPYLDAGEDEY